MHISKEFLLEAVGLSLLVALIFISMQLFQRATRLTGLLEERQENQITQLEEYDIVKYDGIRINGMTALSYIKTVTGSYHVPVKVVTETAEFTVLEISDYAELRKIESETYINPQAYYLCTVIRNENEAIKEITIELER